MGRRILNRKELRADFDAAETRKKADEEEGEVEEEEEEDEDEDEDEDKDEAGEAEAGEAEPDEDEEEAPKKKPKEKKKPAAPKAKRTRTPKITRMRLVWGVFNNSNQCVASYEYPRRKEADDHAARLTTDKRSTHFVQPVKEPLKEKEPVEEKKADEKKAKAK